ncbi:MAG: DUF3326 domain-containing protein [Candidatus Marinimicrobia bacterium]|nr:DUF3326 domain-containing protein [Candidatus Neomarinimicrobiota bacterium]
MIVPTGIGAEIGGHAGDANPAAKLLGAVSDLLIVHPNVVNASDINEMPANALYVDGYMLDGFIAGEIDLKPGYNRKILVAVNHPVTNQTVNAVSAARATIGADYEIIELNTPLRMIAEYDDDGSATGDVSGWEELVDQVRDLDFDALAIATQIEIDKSVAMKYLSDGGVNPWGGVEAKASRLISAEIPKPVAHAPIETGTLGDYREIVDPRVAAEIVSECYIHCLLKGLHRAPQIGPGLSNSDIDFLVSPDGCWGFPHRNALAAGIEVIMVKENKTIYDERHSFTTVAENYLEAAGIIAARNAGIMPSSVRRPLPKTTIHFNND